MSIFTEAKMTKIGDNIFDLSHDRKLSCKMGQLVPILALDTVPGDQIKIQPNAMVRFAPLIAPVMHQASVYMHYFFVPNRIVWPNWEDFITGGPDGTLNPTHPYFSIIAEQNLLKGRLPDYMGIPTEDEVENKATNTVEFNPFPFAAYNKIYNDYYRDQNLEPTELKDELIDGDNSVNFTDFVLMRNRAWQHDYFTSALPWTQRGPEVMLPLGTTAPLTPTAGGDQMRFVDNAGAGVTYDSNIGTFSSTGGTPNGPGTMTARDITSGGSTGGGYVKIDDVYEADLSQATANSIIDLRRAFRLQEFLEKNARGGSRYIEIIKSHFGVNSSDKRLQRAEYIGGSSQPLKISEVLQTSASESDVQNFTTPQGNMSGHGISIGGGKPLGHYSEEHGYIIGIMSIMPKSAYQNGIPRHFLRRDRFDYFWPEFQHIGEQAIQNQELYVNSNDDTKKEAWGYVPRYAEYKYINDSVHGDFRTNLDFWHMGRKFSSLPPLNNDFIKMQSGEVNRIFAVSQSTAPDNLWCHVKTNIKAKRKMARYNIPNI